MIRIFFFLATYSLFSFSTAQNWSQLGVAIDGEASDDRSGPSALNQDGEVLVVGAAGVYSQHKVNY